jgi:uncharacterized protein with ATP-grasp and redox domains
VTNRLPDLLRRTLWDGDFPVSARAHLRALGEEIPHGLIRGVDDPEAPDAPDWRAYVSAVRGRDWLEAPWFFVETYFYRRILEATGYFGRPFPGVDPFASQKSLSLDTDADAIAALAERTGTAGSEGLAPAGLVAAFTTALWGNQADLSMWPGEERPDAGRAAAGHATDDRVLADDRERCARWICDRAPLHRVGVVIDNAGFELVSDLALARTLLDSGAAEQVVLHAKSHPTFISDATSSDVYHLVGELAGSDDGAVQAFGEALETHASEGRLAVTDDFYWTSPLPGWGLFREVYDALAACDLVVSKGDANYRRWLGDRHWAPTDDLHAILDYAPAPLLLLRTLKSEVIAGLTDAAVTRAEETDPDWLVSGDLGVAPFVDAPSGHPDYSKPEG